MQALRNEGHSAIPVTVVPDMIRGLAAFLHIALEVDRKKEA
jgi:hypothetical protein